MLTRMGTALDVGWSKRSGIEQSHCNLVGEIFERAHRDDFVTNGPLGMKIGTESEICVF